DARLDSGKKSLPDSGFRRREGFIDTWAATRVLTRIPSSRKIAEAIIIGDSHCHQPCRGLLQLGVNRSEETCKALLGRCGSFCADGPESTVSGAARPSKSRRGHCPLE